MPITVDEQLRLAANALALIVHHMQGLDVPCIVVEHEQRPGAPQGVTDQMERELSGRVVYLDPKAWEQVCSAAGFPALHRGTA